MGEMLADVLPPVPAGVHPWVAEWQTRVGFGVSMFPQPPDWKQFIRMVQRIEEMGIDSYWSYDHPAANADCWTALAALAVSTEKIRLGTMVDCIYYRPAYLLARQAADVDRASGGRLVLGLGIGRLDGLSALIDKHTDQLGIEALPTRFAAVATDLDSGLPVILDHGPAGRAVAASSSIPIRYEPVAIEGKRLIDGALSAPMPVDAARSLGADFTIAIDVAYRPYEEPVSGITDVASAQAALPKIQEATTELSKVNALAAKLPPESRRVLAGLIAAASPTIYRLCDKVSAMPAVGGVTKPAVDEIRTLLDSLTKA